MQAASHSGFDGFSGETDFFRLVLPLKVRFERYRAALVPWELYRRVDFPTLATYLYGREREQPWHTKHPAKRTAKGSA